MSLLSQPPTSLQPINGIQKQFVNGWIQFFQLIFNALQPIRNDGTYEYVVPTAGFSVVMQAGTGILQLDPAATISTGTNNITLPQSPSDGQRVWIASTKAISGVVLSSGSSATFANTFTSLAAGTGRMMYYNATNNVWYTAI
jgi:hypothetical protein